MENRSKIYDRKRRLWLRQNLGRVRETVHQLRTRAGEREGRSYKEIDRQVEATEIQTADLHLIYCRAALRTFSIIKVIGFWCDEVTLSSDLRPRWTPLRHPSENTQIYCSVSRVMNPTILSPQLMNCTAGSSGRTNEYVKVCWEEVLHLQWEAVQRWINMFIDLTLFSHQETKMGASFVAPPTGFWSSNWAAAPSLTPPPFSQPVQIWSKEEEDFV